MLQFTDDQVIIAKSKNDQEKMMIKNKGKIQEMDSLDEHQQQEIRQT